MPDNVIGVIERVEDDDYLGKAFKKVYLKDGRMLKIKHGRSGYLMGKWHFLEEWVGKSVCFEQGDFEGKPFTKDFDLTVIKEGVDPVPPPPHEDEPTKEELATPKPVNPMELGMWFKELGNRIGDGSLDRDYPTAAVKIKGQYYKKMSEITGVQF